MTSHEVIAALRKSYEGDAWAFLEQVGNATGYGTDRHADAIAMSLWPSRGLTLHGFEVKVSRSDWKRELEKPGKAEPIAAYCDYWTVVAPKGIVPPFEVPTTWGLVEVDDKGRTRTAKKPEKLKAAPIDRGFVAAILRKASAATPTIEMRNEARQEAQERAAASLESQVDFRTSELRGELETLRRRIREFETDLGVPLEGVKGRWGYPAAGDEIARAFRYLVAHDPKDLIREAKDLSRIADKLHEVAGELRETARPEPAAAG